MDSKVDEGWNPFPSSILNFQRAYLLSREESFCVSSFTVCRPNDKFSFLSLMMTPLLLSITKRVFFQGGKLIAEAFRDFDVPGMFITIRAS